jgi:nucleoside-diphosphate-sugar epimerase
MSRSVVTGVAGFIGSHLAEHLVALGHEVVGIDCFTSYPSARCKRANLAALMAQPRFQVVAGDFSTVDLDPVLEGADYVFHQAAQAGVTGTVINIGGSRAMLQDAVGQRAPRLLDFVPVVDIIEGLHRQVAWQLGVCTTPLQEGGRLAAAV